MFVITIEEATLNDLHVDKIMNNYLCPLINQAPQRQEGAVLVVALILLVVLTMLGISAIESTKLETRMAANTEEYNRTFQMAEAGLVQTISGKSKTELQGFAVENEFIRQPDIKLQDADGNDLEGRAECCLMKPKAERQGLVEGSGTDTSLINFLVRSTGFNTDDTNALQITLVGGVVMVGPKKPDVQTQSENPEDDYGSKLTGPTL